MLLVVWPAVGVHRMRTQHDRHRCGQQHNPKTLLPVSLARVNAASDFKVAASSGDDAALGVISSTIPTLLLFGRLDHPAFGLALAVCARSTLVHETAVCLRCWCMETSPAKLELEEKDLWG